MENNHQSHQIAAAIEELIKGQEFVAQLCILLRDVGAQGSDAAGNLVEEIKSSLSRALGVLSSIDMAEVKQRGSVCSDYIKTEACGNKRKSCAGGAGGRGGYNKGRQASHLRTVISYTFLDEYEWRKYGQKSIHSSKFPRSYYRCTHKYDQHCAATKHVQNSESDPSLFLITYLGVHTCTRSTFNPDLAIHSSPSEPSIISFGSNSSRITQEAPLMSNSSRQQKMQQECDEEVLSKLDTYQGTISELRLESASYWSDETLGLHCPETSSLHSPINKFVDYQRDEELGLQCFADSFDTDFISASLDVVDDVLNPEDDHLFNWIDVEGFL